MNLDLIYLITEQLFSNASTHPLCNRNWKFAIYKSLLVTIKGNTEGIIWTKYNQWKIDHNFRSAKSAASRSDTKLRDFIINYKSEDAMEINISFLKDGVMHMNNATYSRNGFPSGLWEVANPNGETILMSSYERDQLYDASLTESSEAINIPTDDVQINHSKQDISILKSSKEVAVYSAKERTKNEEKRISKFNGFKNILDSIRDVYHKTDNEQERSYMELVVGAAIFYLPTQHDQFCGHISINALKGSLIGNHLVKDHIYPRKLAARKLLKEEVSLEKLIEEYQQVLSKFMYVTTRENYLLVNYYEEHTDHDAALVAFQIEKFPVLSSERFKSHRELMSFVSFIKERQIHSKNIEEITELLSQFRELTNQ